MWSNEEYLMAPKPRGLCSYNLQYGRGTLGLIPGTTFILIDTRYSVTLGDIRDAVFQELLENEVGCVVVVHSARLQTEPTGVSSSCVVFCLEYRHLRKFVRSLTICMSSVDTCQVPWYVDKGLDISHTW